MLMVAASAGTAVVLAVAAAGGTYAFLNSSRQVPGATLTAGTATLAVTTPLALTPTTLYPGSSVRGTAVVSNTGNVPLRLRVAGLTPPGSATAFTSALTIGVGIVTASTECSDTFVPTWTGTFASATPADLPVTLARPSTPAVPASSAMICVRVALSTTAPDGAKTQPAANFAVLIDGRQQQ
jgi:tripartite-type tricarboxylate transporter receptor subunit TctC